MDPDDINRALQEIYERLGECLRHMYKASVFYAIVDPAAIEFLKKRGANEKRQKPTGEYEQQMNVTSVVAINCRIVVQAAFQEDLSAGRCRRHIKSYDLDST